MGALLANPALLILIAEVVLIATIPTNNNPVLSSAFTHDRYLPEDALSNEFFYEEIILGLGI